MEQGRQKLRSTCDRCTQLKVRCNKQRPSCERCTKAFEKCVYAPYRWKGRPGPGTEKIALNLQGSPGSGQAYLSDATNQLSRTSVMASVPTATRHPFAVLDHAPPAMGWQTHVYQDVDEFMGMLGSDLQMMDPGSAPPHQDEQPAVALPDTDLESVASWDQVEREPKPRATAFDMTSQPSAVDHYECDRIILGLLEGLRHSFPQCQSVAKLASETSPQESGRSSSSNQVMKSNRAARQHLDVLLTRRCRTTCLAQLDSTYLVKAIFARIQTRYEDVFSSIAGDPAPSVPCSPKASNDGSDTGHVRSGAVFFEPSQFEDFPLGHEGEMRINAELLLCELQAFESVVARFGDIKIGHRSQHGGHGERGIERTRANSNIGAEAAFEAHLRDRIFGLKKRIRSFRDSLA